MSVLTNKPRAEGGSEMTIRREWAMPNRDTFSIPPIREWVKRFTIPGSVSVDPFARNSELATYRNDLNPETSAQWHLEAVEFLKEMARIEVRANLIFFDPPYSPRQISECYSSAGLTATMRDTQNARLYAECRKMFTNIAAPGCVALSFGWNSTGMGKPWLCDELLIVCHGSAHNDTICVADTLPAIQTQDLFAVNPLTQ